MTEQPVLVTERLRLRRPRADDAAGVQVILTDPRTVAHNPSDALTGAREAEALVAMWMRHWDEHRFGYCCVDERVTGRFIGYTGIKRATINDHAVLNLVYRLRPEAWGLGYATEAAGAVVAWARTHLPGEVVVARVRPDNLPSRRVALKIGLHRDPELDAWGHDGPDQAFTTR